MTYRELVSILTAHGCEFVRQGKGSHEVWQCPGGCRTSIPRHPGDIPEPTLRNIRKQLRECLGKDVLK